MKNNFVAKHDFNRSAVHKDKKNDYQRSWSLDDLCEGRTEISIEQYERLDGDFNSGIFISENDLE